MGFREFEKKVKYATAKLIPLRADHSLVASFFLYRYQLHVDLPFRSRNVAGPGERLPVFRKFPAVFDYHILTFRVLLVRPDHQRRGVPEGLAFRVTAIDDIARGGTVGEITDVGCFRFRSDGFYCMHVQGRVMMVDDLNN